MKFVCFVFYLFVASALAESDKEIKSSIKEEQYNLREYILPPQFHFLVEDVLIINDSQIKNEQNFSIENSKSIIDQVDTDINYLTTPDNIFYGFDVNSAKTLKVSKIKQLDKTKNALTLGKISDDKEFPITIEDSKTSNILFKRELELILGDNAGIRPDPHSLMGEKWAKLTEEEKIYGLTIDVRQHWTRLFWEWRKTLGD